MTYRQTMRELAGRTAPPSHAVARVQARLGRAVVPTTSLLQQLPEVDDAAATRVRARLAERRTRRHPVAIWVGGLAIAGAAAAALGGVWLSEAPVEPVVASLAGTGDQTLTDDVTVSWTGTGTVAGTTDDLTVAWDAGHLSAAIEPDQGVTFQVDTREATVRVVGTAFDVQRDSLGTRVDVTRGTVEVSCHRAADEPPQRTLHAGESTVCLPVSATGMLGRAQALDDGGATPEVVLDAVDDGLELVSAGDEAVHVELLVEKMGALLADGRTAEARATAERALALPGDGGRAEELHRALATLSLVDGDCAAAVPHLQALERPSEAELAHLDRCTGR
jgi:hypothetical protein